MESTTWYRRVWTAWQTLSRAGKVAAVVCLSVIVAIAIWHWHQAQQIVLVPLLEGNEVTAVEAQRMRMAFAKANLSDFTTRDQVILVPQHRWAAYSQALLEHDAVPDKLRIGAPPAPTINILATKRQQELLELHQRKQNLRDLIIRLPFVESVLVDLDVIETTSPYQPRQYSCIISIQPPAGQVLHDDEVDSIRRIVLGAVAGAAPDRIYVTDLNCGLTHDPLWTSAHMTEEPVRWRQMQAKHELQEKIQHQLAAYGPIDLFVRIVPDRVLVNPPMISDPLAAAPLAPPETGNGQASSMPVVGSNGQASVKGQVPTTAHLRADAPDVPARAAAYSPPSKPAPEFSVSLTIPESTVRTYWESSRGASDREAAEWNAEEARLAFDKLRLELAQKIRPLLPNSHLSAMDNTIEFAFAAEPKMAGKSAAAWPAWLHRIGFRGSGAAVAIISSLMLAAFLYVTTARRNRRRATDKQAERLDGAANSPRMTEIRQQIDQLIQNDPDTAARVIQQWIRQSH